MKTKKLKFEFPDAPPKEQIEQIKSMKEVVLAMSKLTGETVDLKPFDDAIEKLSQSLTI